ncbi:MAG: polysaccharide deacetylase family protein [Ruminiclostridium sp.]
MYFGSVRFFKHLIITVVILMIAVPAALAVCFGIGNAQKEAEIEELKAQNVSLSALVDYYNGKTDYTAEEFMTVFEQLGIDDKEFVELLYEKDKSAFNKLFESAEVIANSDGSVEAGGDVTTTAVTTTAPPQTTESTTTQEEPPSPYADLHTDLYCENTDDIIYNRDENYIYLTFDDGPSKYTENILSYLDTYDIKATFFVVPQDNEECKRLMKLIVDKGHTIGVHTASHVYTDIYKSVEAYLDDFQTAYDLIYDATGVKCDLFRFPGGSINDYNTATCDAIIEEMTRRGFIYFDWNVDSEDALGATWTQMYNNVLNEVEGVSRAVILMHDHDSRYNTVLVLEDIIKALKNDPKNYTFDRLTRNVKPIQF